MCMASTCNFFTGVPVFTVYICSVEIDTVKPTVYLIEEQTDKQMDRQKDRQKTDGQKQMTRAKPGVFNIFMSVGLRDSSQKPRI